MRKSLLILGFILITIGCSSKQALKQDSNNVTVKGIIDVSGEWIKHKGKKTDLKLQFTNKSHDFVVIQYSDLECNRGSTKGKAFSPIGMFTGPQGNRDAIQGFINGQLVINPDEEKDLLLTCQFKEKDEGDFTLRIKNIYKRVAENGQGVVLKNIAKNVVWKPI